MKKLIALSLAVAMMLALAACGGDVAQDGVEGKPQVEKKDEFFESVSRDNVPEGNAVPEDSVLDVIIASHPSWAYDENWKVWEYIKEGVGGQINVTAIPSSDFGTKFPLLMADKEAMPNVFGFQGKPSGFADYCAQGAFVSLEFCEDFMPNYKAFWESKPEEDQWLKEARRSADGLIYAAPSYGMDRYTNVRCWLYRKDIFEKNNIKTPETMDDLYKAAKKLKAIYPDSYPIAMRSGLGNINVIGCSWKPNFHYGVYYDYDNAEWCYGATEDVMYDIVEYLNKLVKEGLIPANFTTIQTSEWEELVTTNRGFILPAEYQIRIDYFNQPARLSNPEFTLAGMTPPHADNGVGVPKVNKYNYEVGFVSICNKGDAQTIANAARYVDWFYSDEGIELVSWGKEGETFEWVNKDAGERRYILEDGESVEGKYGFKTIGSYRCVTPDCITAAISKEQADTTDFLLDCTYENLDPGLFMELSAEDANKVSELTTSIDTVVQEGLTKFITGQRSLKEWDAFQQELEALPIKEVLEIYDATYSKYQ